MRRWTWSSAAGCPRTPSASSWACPGPARRSSRSSTPSGTRRPDRPALYFSTVSEPLEKIVRFGQSLDFFDAVRGRHVRVLRGSGTTVSTSGLAGVAEQVTATLKERRPGLVVIDSFKALHAFADDEQRIPAVPAPARRAAERLPGRLAVGRRVRRSGGRDAAGVRRGRRDRGPGRRSRAGQREMRFLQVRKLRGSGFRSGQHAYRLSRSGLHLFPRLADLPIDEALPAGRPADVLGHPRAGRQCWPTATGRAPSTLDRRARPARERRSWGCISSSRGPARGEPGVIATLQENPTQLQRMPAGSAGR